MSSQLNEFSLFGSTIIGLARYPLVICLIAEYDATSRHVHDLVKYQANFTENGTSTVMSLEFSKAGIARTGHRDSGITTKLSRTLSPQNDIILQSVLFLTSFHDSSYTAQI